MRQLAALATGLCLVNTNVPLADHTHVCAHREPHDQHRCHCGAEWPATEQYRRPR